MVLIFLKKEVLFMEVKFYLVQTNGEKVDGLSKYEDAIFHIMAECLDADVEVVLGIDWLSVSKMPTLNEILSIERKLVTLGLVIEA